MLPKQKRLFSTTEKASIIAKSYKDGCVITELAKYFGISVKTIYTWRSKLQAKNKPIQSADKIINNSAIDKNFVELSVVQSAPDNRDKNPAIKPPMLKKAELVFDNMTLLLQGQIHSTKLLRIIKLLEEVC